jgi:hypothetical protein
MITTETALEERIVADSYFLDAIKIGKVRGGHPEGVLGVHIEHILDAVPLFPDTMREQLRLGALLHDIGKFAEYWKPHLRPEGINDREHDHLQTRSNRFRQDFAFPPECKDEYTPTHALYSWQYAEQFLDDATTLSLIRYHDTAHRLSRKTHQDDIYRKYFSASPELFVAFAYIDSIDREKDTAYGLERRLVRLDLMKPILPQAS